jgi:hypothetical protein
MFYHRLKSFSHATDPAIYAAIIEGESKGLDAVRILLQNMSESLFQRVILCIIHVMEAQMKATISRQMREGKDPSFEILGITDRNSCPQAWGCDNSGLPPH